ncbi:MULTISPECIES: hypothetical protein [Acidiphilium]|uniref:hypothetical protein n=2 Tax=Acidocellaceae TaxID=3385905 RepID=UPI00257FCA0C|nr:MULTISPECIES: hypothetical protein [Acidiphilium]HQT85050.1 hypothetical protein [Acidiphilium rubrum]
MKLMDGPTPDISTELAIPTSPLRQPVLFVRRGRGRTGGSTLCDWLIQRARRNGRRAQALDGDLRSCTLKTFYPLTNADGTAIEDGASFPEGEALGTIREWLMAELNAMAEDRVSRVLDLGGGDRVIQEFVQDLDLASFAERFAIVLVQAFFLGPDEEDFRHVLATIDDAHFDNRRTILYLNSGVLRTGQNPSSVFVPVTESQEFKDLGTAGIKTIRAPRIICLEEMRGLGLSINDVLANRPGPTGRRAPPTMQIMVEDWNRKLEIEHLKASVGDVLP